MIKKIIAFCIVSILIVLNSTYCFSQATPDPGISGTYAVSFSSYNLGDQAFTTSTFPYPIEVRGSVHYPTQLSAGPFPVLVFLHGRHSTCYQISNTSNLTYSWPCSSGYASVTSFQGYDYLAQQMASHGYIVISISANAINADDASLANKGTPARAALIQHHLDLWKNWNTIGGAPFGNTFIGKLNLQNVGTMGHSRGGEGVVAHALLNKSLGSPYGIKAVLPLAPIDYARNILNDIPLMNVAPYCDGDVNSLAGVYYYDDARYSDLADEAPKHSVLIMGANHNFFNTVWTPGLFVAGGVDDWDYYWGATENHCGSNGANSKRLTPTQQQDVLITYASAFFRVYIGNETAFAPILEVDDIIPPVSSSLDSSEIFVSYHAPASKRLDINQHLVESSEITNTLNGTVSSGGLLKFDICSDDLSEINCSVSSYHPQEPHSGSSGKLGMAQLGMRWDGPTDFYQNTIPIANQDFTTYQNIQFRAAVDFSESASGQNFNYTIQLIDISGAISNLKVGDYTNVMYYPPGAEQGVLPKVCFNSIKIPIADFAGIDLTKIQKIKFIYDQTTAGSIYITDLTLSGLTPVFTNVSTSSNSAAATIYPNPTNNTINVKFENNFKNYSTINLFDIQGKLMYRVSDINKQIIDIDMSSFEKGIYILNVASLDGSKNYKVIKQ